MTAEQQLRTWCEQAVQGDREAGSELLRHFHKPIFAYLRRLSGNDADAEDLTQQTFSKVLLDGKQRNFGISVNGTAMNTIASRIVGTVPKAGNASVSSAD
ncbi:MAG: RNA polymerase sigma factor [Limisphaerales bacterium]